MFAGMFGKVALQVSRAAGSTDKKRVIPFDGTTFKVILYPYPLCS
jgi:hypothetical protein